VNRDAGDISNQITPLEGVNSMILAPYEVLEVLTKVWRVELVDGVVSAVVLRGVDDIVVVAECSFVSIPYQ